MGGDVIGLVAVILSLGIPIAALYTYYRVRKLRTEERLAAIARGVEIPMAPEPSQAARSRRAGVLLVSGAVGYIIMFGLIARVTGEPDTWAAAAFGLLPLSVGIGYLIDFRLVRRESRA
ncbi:MAG TPA: DUF6249 domain-containing protein [Terriglobales bacterium]|nr:DUF6249 domain-containing protein [Terriglobales bacterium]